MLGRMSTILIVIFAVALLLAGCENLPGQGWSRMPPRPPCANRLIRLARPSVRSAK